MMKKACLLLLCACAWLAFSSYPDEYPLFLRALGFQKDEIRDLSEGGTITHGLRDATPGEFGIVAARVVSVPPYYFRDYYLAIENYRTLRNFQNIGKFHWFPAITDLLPLEFTDQELETLQRCKNGFCEMTLTSPEIMKVSSSSETSRVADAYREILLDRLLQYQKSGLDDPASEAQIKRFHDLTEYFQPTEEELLSYPISHEKNPMELFYWVREGLGKQTAITLHHVLVKAINDDFILIDREFYNSRRGFVASMSVMHLIGYADRGAPATLVVVHERVQSDLKSFPFQEFVKNYYQFTLKKQLRAGLKYTGDNMEKRYQGRAYGTFPFGLQARDQR